jgi:protein phosphatase
MRVPIEGSTPGLRYGHSMVYIMPILILFGGSGKNEILNDVWILSTDVTPFKWEKKSVSGTNPLSRVYHTANLYRVSGVAEMMIIFGGRDKENNSLNDLMGLKKDTNGEWEWCEFPKANNNEIVPIGRHQQCAAFFGPFLFVVGGRVGGKEQATFDVYSMNKLKWYRFSYVSLFRHSIWIYYNIVSQDKYEVYLYIYGGFDGDNNSQINSNLYKINVVDLFSKEESLKVELSDYISMLLLVQIQKKNRMQQSAKTVTEGNKTQFTLGTRVVAYNIGEDGTDSFANNIRQLSLHKFTEVDKKLIDVKVNKKKYTYDEQLVREFLQLMPLPEQFVPLKMSDRPIILNREYISNLISQCKDLMITLPTLLRLKYPIKIFGTLNGQYNDLIRYFNFWGRPHEHKGDIESVEYLFLGNFVNRGAFSIEVLCLLMALKVVDNFKLVKTPRTSTSTQREPG